ncbi:hypothetical protein D3C74_372810 [compost metagenome]
MLIVLSRYCKVLVNVAAVIQGFHIVHCLDVALRCKFGRHYTGIVHRPVVRGSEIGAERFERPVHQIAAVHESGSILFAVAVRVLFSKRFRNFLQFGGCFGNSKPQLIQPVLADNDSVSGFGLLERHTVQLAFNGG